MVSMSVLPKMAFNGFKSCSRLYTNCSLHFYLRGTVEPLMLIRIKSKQAYIRFLSDICGRERIKLILGGEQMEVEKLDMERMVGRRFSSEASSFGELRPDNIAKARPSLIC